jgi:predicted TIM-barrel fold metal-dependent hydrolase
VTGPFTDKARKGRPGMTDPVQRLKDMDTEGIDVAVLFGTQIALTVNGLMSGELSAALCHAVNEWLLEYCSADPRRLRAVGLRDISEARDLSLAQKERILGGNAVEFFGLGDLPEPNALKIARPSWEGHESRAVSARDGARR